MGERGEAGVGRMAEVPELVARVEKHARYRAKTALTCRLPAHVLVTSGPTHEPIDPVRFIANRSSGKQGHAIAAAAAALGARVTTLVSGPVTLSDRRASMSSKSRPHSNAGRRRSRTAADIAIFAAAVADWRVAKEATGKIKKKAGEAPPPLALVENPDILKTISKRPAKTRPALVIGFAAETDDVIANAKKKRESKGCDWIAANDVSPETGTFGGDRTTLHLITKAGVESWASLTKTDAADALVVRAARHLYETQADI